MEENDYWYVYELVVACPLAYEYPEWMDTPIAESIAVSLHHSLKSIWRNQQKNLFISTKQL